MGRKSATVWGNVACLDETVPIDVWIEFIRIRAAKLGVEVVIWDKFL